MPLYGPISFGMILRVTARDEQTHLRGQQERAAGAGAAEGCGGAESFLLFISGRVAGAKERKREKEEEKSAAEEGTNVREERTNKRTNRTKCY